MDEFKFNFDFGGVGSDCEGKRDKTSKDTPAGALPQAKRFAVQSLHRDIAKFATPASYTVSGNNLALKYVTADDVQSVILADLATAEQEDGMESGQFDCLLGLSDSKHSDLIPGVYEGGMKTWECAYDLVEYLSDIKFNFTGMNVLELGCGTGLPSIYALMKGAGSISLQDYNPEVINYITIPSVLLNTKHMSHDECHFYSGDWDDLVGVLTSEHVCPPPLTFDLILTSETIYSQSSQPKLLSVMKKLLKPSGCIYVAAKTYYFGVGGTCDNFEELVRADRHFSFNKCRVIESSVPRVIIQLKF